jgi:hypothetical protein
VPVLIAGNVVDTFAGGNLNVQLIKFGFNYSFR